MRMGNLVHMQEQNTTVSQIIINFSCGKKTA
nr:MAG TPA_asm: hypothetical protein [Caudoviricetes sp.]